MNDDGANRYAVTAVLSVSTQHCKFVMALQNSRQSHLWNWLNRWRIMYCGFTSENIHFNSSIDAARRYGALKST